MLRGGTPLRVSVLLAFSAASTCAWAETGVSGALTDPQGKAVPAASIRLLHVSGALVAETRTDDTGQFAFAGVAPGNYRINAAAPGFNAVSKDLVLIADQHATAELRFGSVEGQSQSVVITAKALEPTLDLRNSEVFNRTLFSRDDQVFQQLNAGINAGQHEGGGKSLEPTLRVQSGSWRREWWAQGTAG